MNDTHVLSIRIDKDVVSKLKDISKNQGRSLNKQIEFILREYLDKNSN